MLKKQHGQSFIVQGRNNRRWKRAFELPLLFPFLCQGTYSATCVTCAIEFSTSQPILVRSHYTPVGFGPICDVCVAFGNELNYTITSYRILCSNFAASRIRTRAFYTTTNRKMNTPNIIPGKLFTRCFWWSCYEKKSFHFIKSQLLLGKNALILFELSLFLNLCI